MITLYKACKAPNNATSSERSNKFFDALINKGFLLPAFKALSKI